MTATIRPVDGINPKYAEWVKDGVMIRHSCGWGGTFNPRTSRPWAVIANGQILRTEAGAIRTFASREAAREVARGAA
jgi:hypothetical protein